MATRDASAEDPQGQQRLAQFVRDRRVQLGFSVRAAADASGIARGTWIALEEGSRRTADRNYAAIERTLRWATGSAQAIADGGEPTPLPDPAEPTSPPKTDDTIAPLLSKIMRDDRLTDAQKARVVQILIAAAEAERKRAEQRLTERADELIKLLSED